jgi:hypothetical protein
MMALSLANWATLLGTNEATVTAGLAQSSIKSVDLGGGVHQLRTFYRWRLWRYVRGA